MNIKIQKLKEAFENQRDLINLNKTISSEEAKSLIKKHFIIYMIEKAKLKKIYDYNLVYDYDKKCFIEVLETITDLNGNIKDYSGKRIFSTIKIMIQEEPKKVLNDLLSKKEINLIFCYFRRAWLNPKEDQHYLVKYSREFYSKKILKIVVKSDLKPTPVQTNKIINEEIYSMFDFNIVSVEKISYCEIVHEFGKKDFPYHDLTKAMD